MDEYRELREDAARYRQLVELSPDAIVVHRAGEVVFANPAAARLIGAGSAHQLLGTSVLEFAHPDSRDAMLQRMRHAMTVAESVPLAAEEFLGMDGATIYEVVSRPITYDGQPAMHAIVRDVSARKRMESELRRLRAAVNASSEAILLTDLEGIIRFVNPGFTSLYGYRADEVVGKTTPRILKSGKMAAEDYELYWKTLLRKEPVKGELINRTKDGVYIVVDGSANAVLDEQGAIVGFLGIQRDITERKQMEAKLEELSIHDALTGLYNRRYFQEEVARLERGRRFPVSIVMADLNGLKAVNDGDGHAAGDALLQRAAEVLRIAFRAEDIVARIGGDEFAILLPSTDDASAQQSLGRVRQALDEYNDAHFDTPVSIAFGVSTAARGDALADTLKAADARMYEDKRAR